MSGGVSRVEWMDDDEYVCDVVVGGWWMGGWWMDGWMDGLMGLDE